MQGVKEADILFTEKPNGIATHSVDDGKIGFVELKESQLALNLYVCQRLDKETSGIMAFAKTKASAQKLTEVFESKKAHKKYYFITDKPWHIEKIKNQQILGLEFTSETSFNYKSHIEKFDSKKHISHHKHPPNSETHFNLLKQDGNYSLWVAQPLSGKTHQIRLHASDLGVAILGDSIYGGTPFVRLCLHAFELKFEIEKITYEAKSKPPLFFEQLNLLSDIKLCALLNAIYKRKLLMPELFESNNTVRLVHNEFISNDIFTQKTNTSAEESLELQIDKYGDVGYLYWYMELAPNESDKQFFKKILKYLETETLIVRHMKNRGTDPLQSYTEVFGKQIGESWVARENNVQYLLKTQSGLSPGLFLDQRENRRWILGHSKDKTVLNLFSYTGGFSVCAALGGAKEVTTVDVSANFIEWSKENFKLNNLDPNNYNFWAADSIIFLEGCVKRNKKFDIIICDPPSFSRSKKGVFKLEAEFEKLISLCAKLLNTNGVLLFSTNLEKWSQENIIQKATKALKCSQQNIVPGLESYDFEFPNHPRLMKSIRFQVLFPER